MAEQSNLDFAAGLRMARRILDVEVDTCPDAHRDILTRIRDAVWREEAAARQRAGMPPNTPGVPAWMDGRTERV